MSVVCGLDLSLTSSGVAILVDGRPKLITHVGHKGRDGASYHNRSRRVRSQCQAIMNVILPTWVARGIDLAVIEGPEAFDTFGHAFDRGALWHGVYGALDAQRVPIAVINPKTLKLWFTGAGDASKLRMLDTARAMFREPNEADAIACATAGAFHLGDLAESTFAPIQRQIDALAKVEWPGPCIPMTSTEHVGFRSGELNG